MVRVFVKLDVRFIFGILPVSGIRKVRVIVY